MASSADPIHCEDSRTGFHRWIRSAITGRADFCFWCGARAADARSQGEQQTELEPEPGPGA